MAGGQGMLKVVLHGRKQSQLSLSYTLLLVPLTQLSDRT